MVNRTGYIQKKRGFGAKHISAVSAAFDEGATVHFLARYRREICGPLTPDDLFAVYDDCQEFQVFEKRIQSIQRDLKKRRIWTDKLADTFLACRDIKELEARYSPFKKTSETKADAARKAGLKKLADFLTAPDPKNAREWKACIDFSRAYSAGYTTAEKLFEGAGDIIRDRLRKNTALRTWLTGHIQDTCILSAHTSGKKEDTEEVYRRYDGYSTPLRMIKPHILMALLRGHREKQISLRMDYSRTRAQQHIEKNILLPHGRYAACIRRCISTALSKDLLPALKKDVLKNAAHSAQLHSTRIFCKNLEHTLLAPPAGAIPVMAIDPGFAHGCKTAVLSASGNPQAFVTVYITSPTKKEQAKQKLCALLHQHKPQLICLGNGTAARETRQFLQDEVLSRSGNDIPLVMVNESGASVYSASTRGQKEFPDLDITLRSAVSLGRRVQDPLGELIKIPPHSLGLGQYQHDIDTSVLSHHLLRTVEQVVHRVGADLNTASEDVLATISGLNKTRAKSIIRHRSQKGLFSSRKELLKVAGIGEKSFTQAVGFLRVRNTKAPLENTGIHPERYPLVEKICRCLSCSVRDLLHNPLPLNQVHPNDFTDAHTAEETVKDIFFELRNPGLDPRKEFILPEFKKSLTCLDDLSTGIRLQGVVDNVTDFGAFIDIGLHSTGLVHISEMSTEYISHPLDVVSPGEIITVSVLSADKKTGRIALSMKN
ncbi:MAG: helix-hairpin-helix domain-containing protein [Fibrobacterota bacterium]